MAHSASGQQGGCLRFVSLFFGLGMTVVIIAVSVGVSLMDSPEFYGKYVAWTWDGKSTLVCDGYTKMTLNDKKVRVKKGRAILASDNCELKLVGCDIVAPTAISAIGNAKVTVVGGKVRGKKAAVRASGNATVTLLDTKKKGKLRKSGNATIERQ